jgi:hypothetical protein
MWLTSLAQLFKIKRAEGNWRRRPRTFRGDDFFPGGATVPHDLLRTGNRR